MPTATISVPNGRKANGTSRHHLLSSPAHLASSVSVPLTGNLHSRVGRQRQRQRQRQHAIHQVSTSFFNDDVLQRRVLRPFTTGELREGHSSKFRTVSGRVFSTPFCMSQSPVEMTKSLLAGVLWLRVDELNRRPETSELEGGVFCRRVPRVVLAVIDVVDATRHGGGKDQSGARPTRQAHEPGDNDPPPPGAGHWLRVTRRRVRDTFVACSWPLLSGVT